MWLKYWGKLVDDYSAMQWPCPDGYHVPTKNEWVALCWILTTTFSMANNATTMGTYLKMPKAGYRDYSSSTTGQKDGHGRYWSSMPSATVNNAYYLFFSSATINPQNYDRYAYGYSVRWFKDIPAIPDSNWTILYQGTWSAWVFRNSSLWLISVSWDWTTWYTIQDKNLGATTVYNQWDTLSEDNCGTYFQRWNNYWFVRTWSVTTSSTQVDASDYWPNTENWYYSSDTFIIWNTNWSSVRNNDLRWWVTWIQQKPAPIVKRYYGWKIVSNYSAMRWPCDDGFHVPLDTEWATINTIWQSLGAWTSTWWDNLGIYLKMPYSWFRTQSWAAVSYQWTLWRYHSSYCVSNSIYAKSLYFKSTEIDTNNTTYTKSAWYSLRPFKDEPVVPDNTWTNLYSWTWNAGIYHNSTLWLISLSSDWTTRTTIMDKNLWATAVWNTWDTLSEANCGKYYQWGNNYWFPRTWTISNTSSTQIDATWYWPWNYYSSDTFIKSSSGWDSSRNDNLRWWTTWVQQRPAEIVKIYYGWKLVDDYSAMQWPCDTGFHVPMSSERTSIQTKMGELWIVNNRGAEWRDNFKMPYPWNRALWTGEHIDQWGHWYYWTCTKYSNERNWLFSIYPSGAGTWQWRWADWFSIRPFKDTPVIPDSNWTTLYAWTGDAGIFHNSTLWLISISSDWTTWITIADKNLWATTVYNNWNTLSQDNCGNFYQRWNNYWFPFTWSITISSTLVDAGDYWPWNYYSSSTFITISTSPYNWSSVKNTNLRWWDTWIQQRPAEIRSAY